MKLCKQAEVDPLGATIRITSFNHAIRRFFQKIVPVRVSSRRNPQRFTKTRHGFPELTAVSNGGKEAPGPDCPNGGTRHFTADDSECIQQRMSGVLTVRIAPELLAKADARAAQMGLERARYVRGLIERDLEEGGAAKRRRFASEDLVGQFRLGGQSASNQRVREKLRQRAGHEGHR